MKSGDSAMGWRDKLKKLEKDVAEKRENDSKHENRKKDAMARKAQRAFDDLGILEFLESIRDEIWGAGTIQHEITSYGFEAELFYEYPDYFAGHPTAQVSEMGTESWNPPKIDFTRESLMLKMYIGPVSDLTSLDIRFCHPDYDMLHSKMNEFVQQYGSENISRFWGHDGYVSVCRFTLGDDLSACRETLADLLVQYCAIKSFLPTEEIRELKSKNVIKALRGQLPVELVNKDVIKVLQESGLLNGTGK
jgi:hypothetical protein